MSTFDPIANQPAPRAVAQRFSRMIQVIGDPRTSSAQRMSVDLVFVAELRRALDRYMREDIPARPSEIEDLTDDGVVAKVRAAIRMKALESEREALRAFLTWRCAVRTIEHRNAARVNGLLYALRVLSRAIESGDANPSDMNDILTVLSSEWGVTIGDEVPDYGEADAIATRAGRDPRLPTVLRMIDESGGYVPRRSEPTRIGEDD